MKKPSKIHGWIVLHVPTGTMDGTYFNFELAVDMLEHWRREVPGKWRLLTVPKGQGFAIPDEKFAYDVFVESRASRRG